MKARLKLMGIGAAGGVGLLLIFWLLGDVAHIFRMTLQDSAFFLGMVLFLVGLLMIVRKGKFVPGKGRDMGEEVSQDEEVLKDDEGKPLARAPFLCMGAGLLNLVVCGLTFLF